MIKSGSLFLLLILLVSLLGPLFSSYNYYDVNYSLINTAPSYSHWFGTDELGRDIFTRICYGIRISLFVAISATCIDIIIGICWGSIAGYYGGKVDEIMMRVIEVLCGLPQLLVISLILVIVGPGLLTIILAIALTNWISMARFIRAGTLQIKHEEYIQAAIALGASQKRIIFYHILPNLFGVIISTLTLTIPTAIYMEAFLSFLGLGVPAPFASLGTMANEGISAMQYYPWRLLFPAFAICLTMLSFNLVGEGLRKRYE